MRRYGYGRGNQKPKKPIDSNWLQFKLGKLLVMHLQVEIEAKKVFSAWVSVTFR